MEKIKLVIGITAPQSVDLLNGQLNYFVNRDFVVYLLAPDHPQVVEFCKKEGAIHIPIGIERNIMISKDIVTLFKLIRIFRKYRPDIVNLGTPKISLLGMIAAYLTKVPVRIYTCRGFRFEHESGRFRSFLIGTERLISKLSHRVICISKSVARLGIVEKIFTEDKTVHIGNGSSNGLNLSIFNPSTVSESKIKELKDRYNLNGHFVFGFLGRLVDRKGINELLDAFEKVYEKDQNNRLLVVGRPYFDQIKDSTLMDRYNNHPGVVMTGIQPALEVPALMKLMNVFVLPAWWEGFGNVLIQAAAMGIPIISTKSTGCMDAVSDNYNGVLIDPYDTNALIDAMLSAAENYDTFRIYGTNGLEWVKNFDQKLIWQGQESIYLDLLAKNNCN
jgi:glycosyltransferase involved in cell wall biosynthesis